MDISDLPVLGTNHMVVAAGICIVTSQAATVGVTAVPGPLANIDWDGWMWHWMGIAGVVPGVGGAPNLVVSVPIDTKAMRKWKETDVMVAMVEVEETGVAGSFVSNFDTRVLVKLP